MVPFIPNSDCTPMDEVNVYVPGMSKVTVPMQSPSILPSDCSKKNDAGFASAVPSTLCTPSALMNATVSPTEIVNSFGVKTKSVK